MLNVMFGKIKIIPVIIEICIFGVLIYYVWSAFNGQFIKIPVTNYYSRLTDSLLHGHLYFLENPSPKLLSLVDPYDPSQNEPYRLHDVSLYKGKWYLYFGITPVLILWLPAYIFGIEMVDPKAVPIFCWIGLVASIKFIQNIVYASHLKIASWMWLFVIIILGFNNSASFLLRRPAFYETAISAAYCCSMLALYLYSKGYFNPVRSKFNLAMGSLFLGLSVGARPNYLIWGIVLIAVSLATYDRSRKGVKALWLNEQIALWGPYVFTIMCLAIYNYLRFDSIFEFGVKYMLAGVSRNQINMFSISSLLPNLYFYVLQPIMVDKIFPFFHVLPYYPAALPKGYIGPEPVVGVLSLSPLLYLIPLISLVIIYKYTCIRGYTLIVASIMFLLGIIQLLLISIVLPSATMRYIFDFLPSMLISLVFIIFIVNDYLFRNNKYSISLLFNIVVVIFAIYGAIANIGIGLVGYYNEYQLLNPMSYNNIREKIGYILGRHCLKYHFVLDVYKRGDSTQPIMYFGHKGKGDLIMIEIKNNKVRIGIDHSGQPTTWSKWNVPNIPSAMKLSVEINNSELIVITDDVDVVSPYAPYYASMLPVFGKNDIGFSAASKVANIIIISELRNY